MGIYSTISSYAGCNIFRMSKFWESISDYLTLTGPKHFTRISKIMARDTKRVALGLRVLINCVYFDFVHGLYSIGILQPTYTKNVPKMRTWLLGHAYFILGKLKVFAWNVIGSVG